MCIYTHISMDGWMGGRGEREGEVRTQNVAKDCYSHSNNQNKPDKLQNHFKKIHWRAEDAKRSI